MCPAPRVPFHLQKKSPISRQIESKTIMVSPETATQNGNTKTEFDFTAIHRELNESFASGKTKSIKWRKWQLKQPWWMIEDNEREIQEALTSDLGRHEMENWTTDFMGLKMDILHHINNVEKWVETTPVPGSGIVGWIGRARIRGEPRGVVLIIGAWNFPFLLTL